MCDLCKAGNSIFRALRTVYPTPGDALNVLEVVLARCIIDATESEVEACELTEEFHAGLVAAIRERLLGSGAGTLQ